MTNFDGAVLLASKICSIGVLILPYAMKCSGILTISILLVIVSLLFVFTNFIFLEILIEKKIDTPNITAIVGITINK